MKYMGSKAKISKEILPIILKNREQDQFYIEPFVGGCNVIDKVGGLRIGNDLNPYLISMWKALQKGWTPPVSITEEEYRHIQNNKLLYPSYLVGYVGFNSYGAKFFGGYRRDKTNLRDYWKEHHKNIMKQIPNIQSVLFFNKEYNLLRIPEGSLVYCDPPYQNTTGYSNTIDNTFFWNWIRKISEKNTVYVSEYNAPDDFQCIWKKEVNNTLIKNTGEKQGVEKLFKLKV